MRGTHEISFPDSEGCSKLAASHLVGSKRGRNLAVVVIQVELLLTFG
jgi:hypothetical protein